MTITQRLVAGGYPSYLFGEIGRGWYHYFLVALLVKTPLVTMITAGAGLLAWRHRRLGSIPTLLIGIGPALGLLAMASWSRYDIGLRHVLPVLPAIALLAAFLPERLAPRLRLPLLALVVLALALPGRGISYENVLARGEGGLDRILSDSSIDWGEEIPALAEWRLENPDGLLAAAVLSPLPLTAWGLDANPLPGVTDPDPPPLPPGTKLHWVAISVMNLQGTLFMDPDRYAIFRSREPIADLGGSIRIYDVREDDEARARLRAISRGGS